MLVNDTRLAGGKGLGRNGSLTRRWVITVGQWWVMVKSAPKLVAGLIVSVGFVGQAARVAAQSTLVVTVADAASKDYLPGADVRVVEVQRSAKTDFFGEARISGLAAGQYRIEARLLGYKAEAVTLPFGSTDTLRLTFLLTRIVTTLDTTRVTAANVPSQLSEFEARRALNNGRFLSDSELTASANSDLGRLIAQRFPGLRALNGPAGQGTYLFSNRGDAPKRPRGCPVQVYRDGVRLNAPQEAADLSDFRPQSLLGVEFYNEASIPAEYRSGTVCGVLLLWTK